MRIIARFLLHILANALAILAAEWFVPGVIFQYNFVALIKLALILGIINFFLKPILKILTAPVILLTLGLFTLAINMFLIWLAIYVSPTLDVRFSIQGLNAFFWTTIIIVAFNFVVSVAIKEVKSID